MKHQDILFELYFNMVVGELKLMNNMPSSANITYNSLLYLDIIAYKEKCTVSFIANSLMISKSAVTVKVNELIQQGFVIKTQCQEDKRIHYLSLSGQVAAEFAIYNKNFFNVIQKLDNEYEEKEIETFFHMLHYISTCFVPGDNNEKSTI